jgi:transmembrane sensor
MHKQGLRGHFPSREEILQEARAQTQRQAERQRWRTPAVKAAMLAVVVGSLWTADPVWDTVEVSTFIGQRSSWALADGSRIDLNTNSRLLVETRLRTRRFRLESGEAAFVVAHTWRPFIVDAAGVTIRDIGTVFNVRRHSERVEVSVLEGAVEVAAGAQRRILEAPQKIDAFAAELGPTQPNGAAQAAAWQMGRIVFDGTPLASVVSEISRYRGTPVMVGDSRAARLRVSGSYEIAKLDGLLDSLPLSLPVVVERRSDGTVLIRSR